MVNLIREYLLVKGQNKKKESRNATRLYSLSTGDLIDRVCTYFSCKARQIARRRH